MLTTVPMYQVDAFADALFAGNPAAVCPLDAWLPDAIMQAIAAENNLAETAFFVPMEGGYHLRWFTPAYEIDLCGHATLASAHVLYAHLGFSEQLVRFKTRSGMLAVRHESGRYTLDFPARAPEETAAPTALLDGLGINPVWVGRARDYLVECTSEAEVRALVPRMDLIATLDAVGVIVTARGEKHDVVSRFFAPQAGVPEDPVTGSAHCTIVPYWAAKLGRNDLVARQISARGGTLWCSLKGDRVEMAGTAHTYLKGEIYVPQG